MRKILVFGCKHTGKGLWNLLKKDIQNDVWLYDDNIDDSDVGLKSTGKILSMYAVRDTIHTFDLVIFTPSIRRDNWLIELARQNKVKTLNEFEFCFLRNKAKTVCVTGTDGKTTTSLMIKAVLDECDKKSLVAGNIGHPFASCCDDLSKNDVLIGEVSSFMLQDSHLITPDVAIVTNISYDHLDWHKSFKNYCIAKSNLVKYLSKNNLAIFNADDENSTFLQWSTNARVLQFSLRKKVLGAYLFNDWLWLNTKGISEKIIHVEELQVRGLHNMANALCAILACAELKIDNGIIASGLKKFKGVAHRLEKLFEIDNVVFVNDSKSTSVHSTKWALKAFKDKSVGLILGGRKKTDDYSALFCDEDFSCVKSVAFVGEAKEELYETAKNNGISNCFVAEDLNSAVKKEFELLKQQGGVLLFSPACSSFDSYKNFEERGYVFCEIAKKIKENE